MSGQVYTNQGTITATAIVSLEPDRSGNFLGDGTADDVEINAAIVYVTALGGGSVCLGIGQFNITATITLDDNIIMYGQGEATILFLVAGSDVDVVGANTKEGIILRDFAINGNRDNNAAGIGILFVVCDYSKILRVTVHECEDEGIEYYTCTYSEISGCTVYDCGDDGIYVYFYSDHIKCSNNVVYGVGDHGINFGLSGNCIVTENSVRGVDSAGIQVYRVWQSIVSDNILDTNVLSGAYAQIHVFGSDARNTDHIIISNNEVIDQQGTRTGWAGVRVGEYAHDVIIEGNSIYGNLRGIGVATSTDCYDVLIENNLIADATGHGVESYGVDVLILGNIIKDNGANGVGIMDAATTGNAVLHNSFSGNVLGPIVDVGTGTILENSIGYIIENSGTQTCADNENISHGLNEIPTFVSVIPMNDTYDNVPVIATVDWSNVGSTNIKVGLYWVNGTIISDDVILISWKAEYKP